MADLPFTGGNSVLFGLVALVFLAIGSISARAARRRGAHATR